MKAETCPTQPVHLTVKYCHAIVITHDKSLEFRTLRFSDSNLKAETCPTQPALLSLKYCNIIVLHSNKGQVQNSEVQRFN